MFFSYVYERRGPLLIFAARDIIHLAIWKGSNKEHSPADSIMALLFSRGRNKV
jgi:hypothetical protein